MIQRVKIMGFYIDATDLKWLEGVDERDDLCLHGHAVAIIGKRKLEYDATVSATALYLLKTVTENHKIYTDNRLLPCCGFSIFANKALDNVLIAGCDNGIDWSVFHDGDRVILELEDGTGEEVPIGEYKRVVFAFADKIEAFYKNSAPKILPRNKIDRDGYIAFWNEWRRRRSL